MNEVSEASAAGRHVGSITLVRHGQTDYNAVHRMQGQIDIPLNSVGLWQAKQAGEALRQDYVENKPDRKQLVIASDLARAYATAQAFAEPLGLTIHADQRLRERSFGSWEGETAEDVRERWPEDFHSWMLSGGGELKHGAEPKSAVGQRGLEALEDWIGSAGEDTDLFVFTHGSWIAQTIQTLMGISQVRPDFASLGSMRNAHWARFVPRALEDGHLRWSLLDYNRGPVIARQVDWSDPNDAVSLD
ncbi:phosphoglycerate mutase [Bifidobacterium actinocoloniiforme DSM 22766]|uniref:Phosphoglycerate mutase n=1 Tax=Bifidobacterium actinocoloniiforme DSM 22766 TaxID=1437605 RepID=A0A086Z0M3_9BIFI|nr:histidine phosphatase family protein [Bifidobacterium actinocoloniiforme]AKV55287.1 phosphoglycerate mutase [Bifidobacterium actinocoloniiforme DSM 22766]KFI40073.1 phosphoglycerate mutase [Bifidobacterium actinocoloniiforme DSM 22766]